MSSGSAPTLLWSAGDPSGDRHAARVVAAIRARRPDVRSLGLGGPAMAAAGVELIARLDEVAVVGLTEVVGRLGAIAQVRRRLTRALADRRHDQPALFIPVDYPGMNLDLTRRAAGLGVPVVYYISPQLWAWGAGRMRGIQASVARMLVFFDFEADLYQKAGVPVTFVGHPLVEQVAEVAPRADARAALGIAPEARVLVLMPGSRPGEVAAMLEPMLDTARGLRARHPELQIWLRVAPGIDRAPLAAAAERRGVELRFALEGDARIVRAADLALAAAGTATLETALLGTPLVIVYRVSWLTYQIARRLVRLPWIGLVNVVAGKLVAPEFIQGGLKGPAVIDAADRLLTDRAARREQLAAFREVAARLGAPGAAERAASAILAELDREARVMAQEKTGSAGGEVGGNLALAAYQSSLRLLLPFLRLRRRYFRDPAMARERAGEIQVPLRYQTGDPRLWYHGASVGEISALPPILAEMERRAPGGRAMVSALTDTGLDSARRLFSPERVFALPVDLPGPLARAMDALQPTALIIAETELWPSLCGLARARRVPVLIVNGRLSPKSVRRYRTLGPLFRPAAQALAGVAAQSEGDRERFIAIGVPDRAVAVLGSSKFDAVPWDPPPTSPTWIAGRPVVVCGSTREGDERLVADLLTELDRMAPAPQVLAVLAPRHLPRVPAIQALLRRHGFEPRLRSADPAPLAEAVASSAARGDRILLLDSLGELAAAYRLGVVALVGGGFSAPGGHNLLEPAARGRAVAFGMKQRSAAGEDELLVAAGGGFRCADARALARALAPLVRDLAAANDAGRRARAAVAGARGAAARIADFILARLALGERGTP